MCGGAGRVQIAGRDTALHCLLSSLREGGCGTQGSDWGGGSVHGKLCIVQDMICRMHGAACRVRGVRCEVAGVGYIVHNEACSGHGAVCSVQCAVDSREQNAGERGPGAGSWQQGAVKGRPVGPVVPGTTDLWQAIPNHLHRCILHWKLT